MISKDAKSLLSRLNGHMNVALQAAAGYSMSLTHYKLFPDHLILKLLEDGTGDLVNILKHYSIEPDDVFQTLTRKLSRFSAGNTEIPRYSLELMELIEAAWVISSIHLGQSQIRSGALVEPFLEDPRYTDTPFGEAISSIEAKTLRKEFKEIVDSSSESTAEMVAPTAPAPGVRPEKEGASALDLYTVDFTEKARKGEIDPVYGRDDEIHQVIDILSRRRKNNPILVGDAGVGKTAVVEGLAYHIAHEDVVESLRDAQIRNLDLGLLQAGASVKGEFENRLRKVINEVVESPERIILFIDEAHTLIGAGGAAGVGDAANLLKPALARGQLKTVGATTWSEYKKYIEKDPALERRFQMVKVDEPDESNCAVMLRGIKSVYESHHGVTITEAAVKSAVNLSKRYISGRQLPDKAVDLLDTAASRVKITGAGKPHQLALLERRRMYLGQRIEGIERDQQQGYGYDEVELQEVRDSLDAVHKQITEIESKWKKEQELADKISELRQKLNDQPLQESNDKGDGSGNGKGEPAVLKEIETMRGQLLQTQGDDPLVLAEVDAGVVASVVSDWTGIPVGRMMRDQATSLLEFEKVVSHHIIGQDHALAEIASNLRVAKSGMATPDSPVGVFLFIGPSGVGKTETARIMAELLLGAENMMVTINMSEYQEKHTVSQLKGSPPGYVGYGEGGVLTEAVRRRPHCIVLLDEVEKAHLEVMNLFYQVFDKGFMRDGEGREIDFRNTIILMTSNIGSDLMMKTLELEKRPTPGQLLELVRPEMYNHFQPAFLARTRTIPFFPLDSDAIVKIVELKLNSLAKRLQAAHRIEVVYNKKLTKLLAEQCSVKEMGARNVDHVIERVLLPDISRSLVEKLADNEIPRKLTLTTGKDRTVSFAFE